MSIELARRVLRTEIEAIERLEKALEEDGVEFGRAVEAVLACTGRVVWSGMGKSGIICRKLAATMASTGTPALFLHPAEAVHGDLGMVTKGDLVIAVSNSGSTEEILRLVAILERLGVSLIGVSSNPDSPLAEVADIHLDLMVRKEACPLGLAPTASTTATLALGDALCMAVSKAKGFREEDFAILHPGGKLGRRFLKVRDLMHGGERTPSVTRNTSMADVIYEMSKKGLGMTTVVDEAGRLLGVITDGDLRRLMQRGDSPLELKAFEVMHKGGFMISADELAPAGLQRLEEHRITSLVVAEADEVVEGILHIHDLWGVDLF